MTDDIRTMLGQVGVRYQSLKNHLELLNDRDALDDLEVLYGLAKLLESLGEFEALNMQADGYDATPLVRHRTCGVTLEDPQSRTSLLALAGVAMRHTCEHPVLSGVLGERSAEEDGYPEESATERIFAQYVHQRPSYWRKAYMHDAMMHAHVEQDRRTLYEAEKAMRDEGVPEETVLRVLRKVVFGDADHRGGEDE